MQHQIQQKEAKGLKYVVFSYIFLFFFLIHVFFPHWYHMDTKFLESYEMSTTLQIALWIDWHTFAHTGELGILKWLASGRII